MGAFTPWLLFAVLFSQSAIAAIKPYIPTEAEYNTECKTCPRSLCPNQLYYGYYDPLNVTCWTHGTEIMGDDLWLKSEAGCYITQYDVLEYDGDYTTDLAYCGRASEIQELTLAPATLVYKTECRICPEINCDVVAYLNEDTDLDLTCWYPDGQLIIDDPFWLKTTNNCYIARKNLYLSTVPSLPDLDNCGPVPLLEIANHNNENGTSEVNKRADLGAMYLINVTVGEEYAYCRSCAAERCEVEKTYEFNEEVWLQCLENANYANGTSEWWSLTTDFCYMVNTDFWESPQGDYYRMPACERFEGDESGSPDDE
ncbi:hypothetical protein BDW02DRAFT_504124 [Decorospora gaudefroyi]|uniref:Apple domain-containing protein n=1 Tax=Decorospora gaudefroyi TaxID=184978 RepID=A0A6A5KAY9_9PLEO|nr:hypothetical protein BDW02DRAFT_504124 [Decorospora gaudefroyi]